MPYLRGFGNYFIALNLVTGFRDFKEILREKFSCRLSISLALKAILDMYFLSHGGEEKRDADET